MKTGDLNILLFFYGTLQSKAVQISSFGQQGDA